jgi:hypothetical protein
MSAVSTGDWRFLTASIMMMMMMMMIEQVSETLDGFLSVYKDAYSHRTL